MPASHRLHPVGRRSGRHQGRAARSEGQPWRIVGIPDGLGAFDNGDGTMTVLMNEELGATAGVVREHGSTGAFVSQLIVDTDTLEVLSARGLVAGRLPVRSHHGHLCRDHDAIRPALLRRSAGGLRVLRCLHRSRNDRAHLHGWRRGRQRRAGVRAYRDRPGGRRFLRIGRACADSPGRTWSRTRTAARHGGGRHGRFDAR